MHALFIDDLSEAEADNLQRHLVGDPFMNAQNISYQGRASCKRI